MQRQTGFNNLCWGTGNFAGQCLWGKCPYWISRSHADPMWPGTPLALLALTASPNPVDLSHSRDLMHRQKALLLSVCLCLCITVHTLSLAGLANGSLPVTALPACVHVTGPLCRALTAHLCFPIFTYGLWACRHWSQGVCRRGVPMAEGCAHPLGHLPAYHCLVAGI